MDYLERNIKTTSQKTVLVPTAKMQGSSLMFWLVLGCWLVMLVSYKFCH